MNGRSEPCTNILSDEWSLENVYEYSSGGRMDSQTMRNECTMNVKWLLHRFSTRKKTTNVCRAWVDVSSIAPIEYSTNWLRVELLLLAWANQLQTERCWFQTAIMLADEWTLKTMYEYSSAKPMVARKCIWVVVGQTNGHARTCAIFVGGRIRMNIRHVTNICPDCRTLTFVITQQNGSRHIAPHHGRKTPMPCALSCLHNEESLTVQNITQHYCRRVTTDIGNLKLRVRMGPHCRLRRSMCDVSMACCRRTNVDTLASCTQQLAQR